MAAVEALKRYLSALVRARHPLHLSDQLRLEPASRVFGMDRGTPIDRVLIERFIASHSGRIAGTCAEVGDTRYLDRFGNRVVSRTVIVPALVTAAPSDALVFDLEKGGVFEAFDTLVVTQTLQFVFELRRAIRSIHESLLPGGFLIGTVPGISQVSSFDMDRWGDFWRFTDVCVRRLLEEEFPSASIVVQALGNLPLAKAFLEGASAEDVPNASLFEKHDPEYQLVVGFVAQKGAPP